MKTDEPTRPEIADAAIARVMALSRSEVRESVGDRVIEYVRMLLFDAVCCAYAARNSPPVRKELSAFGTCPGAIGQGHGLVLFGIADGLHVEDAAVVNGTMVRYLDANDTYIGRRSPCHPSDNVATILTAAAYWECTLGDVVKAIVSAYGIHMYLADRLPLHGTGWHNVSGGSIAVPITVGVVLAKLSAVKARHALGLSCMRGLVGPSSPGEISMVKAAAHALGAAESIRHVKMAQSGFTAPRFVIEGFVSRAGWGDAQDALRDFAVDWSNIERVSIKPYPCAVFMHTAIEAILELRREAGVTAEVVEYVRIVTLSFVIENNVRDRYAPQTRETADHSLPYCAAIALLEGQLGVAQFEDEKWRRPDVRRLMRRVTVVPSAEMDRLWPKRPAQVEIGLTDGKVVSRRIDVALGDPGRKMTWAALADKANGLVGTRDKWWVDSALTATRYHNLGQSAGSYLAELSAGSR